VGRAAQSQLVLVLGVIPRVSKAGGHYSREMREQAVAVEVKASPAGCHQRVVQKKRGRSWVWALSLSQLADDTELGGSIDLLEGGRLCRGVWTGWIHGLRATV